MPQLSALLGGNNVASGPAKAYGQQEGRKAQKDFQRNYQEFWGSVLWRTISKLVGLNKITLMLTFCIWYREEANNFVWIFLEHSGNSRECT